ncbi:MAG: hypothetical protein IM619_13080, partial [Phenylobacterium sp.]|nr:hypothetical protein [Phenylobacterium sp.]
MQAPRGDRLATAVSFVVALQTLAAVFFIGDALVDVRSAQPGLHVATELVIALALLAGVAVGALQVRRLWVEGR